MIRLETTPAPPASTRTGVESYVFRPEPILAQREQANNQAVSLEMAWAVAYTSRLSVY